MDKDFTDSLSASRQELLKKFLTHDWFKATSEEIQKELLNLPEDHDGFLESLVARPDEIGEVDVLKLVKFSRGNFLLIPTFEVRSNITNQIYTHEYASWKTGRNPGARGIIFLETDGQISHFLVSKSYKFSTAEESYDSIGGMYSKIEGNQIGNLSRKIEDVICKLLNLEKLTFKNVYLLGPSHPDHGMSNNQSDLFAAVIDISNIKDKVIKTDTPLQHKKMGMEFKIVKISDFKDYIQNKIKDNFFLSIAARILTRSDIRLPI